jgi:hypothetical protein
MAETAVLPFFVVKREGQNHGQQNHFLGDRLVGGVVLAGEGV